LGEEGTNDRKILKQRIIVWSIDYFFCEVAAGTVTNPVPAFAKEVTARYVVDETMICYVSR
jgi:hypothetical protein